MEALSCDIYLCCQTLNLVMTPPSVPYTSSEQYHELEEKAVQIHLDMIDTPLLRFHAQFARFEIDDLAHCTSWHEKSKAAFLDLTLGRGDQWCEDAAYMLWFTLKQCLLTALLFIPEEDLVGRMYEVPKAREVAVGAINEFFESPFMMALYDSNSDFPSDSEATPKTVVS